MSTSWVCGMTPLGIPDLARGVEAAIPLAETSRVDLQTRIVQVGVTWTCFPYAIVRTPTRLFIVPMPPTSDAVRAAESLDALAAAFGSDQPSVGGR